MEWSQLKELTKWSSLAAEGWAPSHNPQKREKEEREQAQSIAGPQCRN